MRAHQAAGFAYWLLAAIYLLAALGGALASGHVGDGEDDRWMMWRLVARHPAALLATPTTTVGAADYTVLKKLSTTRC